MKKMFLAVDAGNSYVKFGLFEGSDLKSVERVEHARLAEFLSVSRQKWLNVKSAVSSVTPSLQETLRSGIGSQTGSEPRFLGFRDITTISLSVDSPETVGMDRLLNCIAGHGLYREDLVVVDLGTATTIDVVTQKGEFLGGMILPGIDSFKSALFQQTELLSPFREAVSSQTKLPKTFIGRNTREAISAGVVGGYHCLLEGLLKRVKDELGQSCRVIATGGGVLALDVSAFVSETRPNLSLEGVKAVYDSLQ